jgi:type IV pilus assembly protein PilO
MNLGVGRPVNYKFLCVFTVMMAFVLWFYMYVLLPQELRITELKAAKMELERKNAVVQDFSKKHADTNTYLAEIDKKTAWVDAMLPNSAELGGFLTQLEQAAEASSVQLSEVKPGQNISKAGYQAVPIEVTIRGTFAQILSFLQRLDNAKRFTSVNNVSVKSQQGMLDGKLTIVIYSFDEAAKFRNQQTGQ